ncbi:hypothetical protein EPN81_01235 [Patescibacteria group bacterium]|nr:MAG: hypothetical protein EPN81_01235 [Patescibacteria group bacterium]
MLSTSMKFHSNKALATDPSLAPLFDTLSSYRDQLGSLAHQTDYLQPESSIQLPGDATLLKKIQETAERLHSPTLQYVVIIGIGGSNLGTQAVYEAIAGSMHLLVDRLPKLLFLDTVTDEKMTAVTRVIEHLTHKEDFLVIVISKSGTTTETIANMEVLWNCTTKQFGDVRERFIFITDEASKLWNAAKEHKMETLSIPTQVGGRFSVFSAVGLLPLALAGINIVELIEGAQRAVADGTSAKMSNNHSLVSACLTYLQLKSGRSIRNTFFFSPKLSALGAWERQLVAESLGKDGKGIMPIISIGSTDLHSMAQLYWGGSDITFTNLVFSFTGAVHRVSQHLALPGLVQHISGTSLEGIMQAIYAGVKAAYEKSARPYVEIDLEQADARELGYYLQFRMIEVMYLGRLLDLNVFDQPAVEMYKSVTRDLLESMHVR